jgi:muconolactone delta-isomerase
MAARRRRGCPRGAVPRRAGPRTPARRGRRHATALAGPGRWANWGLWEAEDATALHEAISSLPLWPWMSVTVHPLAVHVNDLLGMGLDER